MLQEQQSGQPCIDTMAGFQLAPSGTSSSPAAAAMGSVTVLLRSIVQPALSYLVTHLKPAQGQLHATTLMAYVDLP